MSDKIQVVRPSLGRPLILTPADLREFVITVAGKEETPPPADQIAGALAELTLSFSAGSGPATLSAKVKAVLPATRYPDTETSPPTGPVSHQVLAGFRWECPVLMSVELPPGFHPPRGWPAMCDLVVAGGVHPHAVVITERPPAADDLRFIHATDPHVAGRWDAIERFACEHLYREGWEQRLFRSRYSNANDDLRAFIRQANQIYRSGELDFIVMTGDLVDYIVDGYFDEDLDYHAGYGKDAPLLEDAIAPRTNFQTFVDIITGADGQAEALCVPLFVVPGNHEYLLNEPLLAVDCYVEVPWYWQLLELLPLLVVPVTYGFVPDSVGVPAEKNESIDRYADVGLFEREGLSYDQFKTGQAYDADPTVQPQAELDNILDVLTGKPEWFSPYLTSICYDTDYAFAIGPHQFVMLNSGADIGIPSKDAVIYDHLHWGSYSRAEELWLANKSQNRGLLPEHQALLDAARARAAGAGQLFVFSHAPLLDRNKDIGSQWDQSRAAKLDTGADLSAAIEAAGFDEGIGAGLIQLLGCGGDGFSVAFSGHTHQLAYYHLKLDHQRQRMWLVKGTDAITKVNPDAWRYVRPIFLGAGTLRKRHYLRARVQGGRLVRASFDHFPRWHVSPPAGCLALFVCAAAAHFAPFGFKGDARVSTAPRDRYDALQDADREHVMTELSAHLQWMTEILAAVVGSRVPSWLLRMQGTALIAGHAPSIFMLCDLLGIDKDTWTDPLHTDEAIVAPFRALLSARAQGFVLSCCGLKERPSWASLPRLSGPLSETLEPYLVYVGLLLAAQLSWLNRFGLWPNEEHHFSDLRGSLASLMAPLTGFTAVDQAFLKAGAAFLNGHPREIARRVVALCDDASADAQRPLRLFYTSESCFLAELGGYRVTRSNELDPAAHLAWASRLPPTAVVADLQVKYALMAERQRAQGGIAGLREFFSRSAARLASWSVSEAPASVEAQRQRCASWDEDRMLAELRTEIAAAAARLRAVQP